MKFFSKTLGLMLASLALASCGGGGGDGGTFVPQSGTITLAPGTTTLPTNTGTYKLFVLDAEGTKIGESDAILRVN